MQTHQAVSVEPQSLAVEFVAYYFASHACAWYLRRGMHLFPLPLMCNACLLEALNMDLCKSLQDKCAKRIIALLYQCEACLLVTTERPKNYTWAFCSGQGKNSHKQLTVNQSHSNLLPHTLTQLQSMLESSTPWYHTLQGRRKTVYNRQQVLSTTCQMHQIKMIQRKQKSSKAEKGQTAKRLASTLLGLIP